MTSAPREQISPRSIAVIAVVVAIAALAFVARMTTREPTSKPLALGPLVAPLEARSDIPSLTTTPWFGAEGFVAERDRAFELVPAILPPTSEDGRVRILAFIELPRGAKFRFHAGSLMVPEGTLAMRIEAFANVGDDATPRETWRVLDVRATRFSSGGEVFHLLRRGKAPFTSALGQSGAPLLTGLAWPRSDEGALQARAAIAAIAEADRFAIEGGKIEQTELATRLQRINDCASCHVPERSEATAAEALVQKGTDGSGLFQIKAVLSDDAPFERYRPKNPNLEDPHVSVRCAGGVPATSKAAACADGRRPRGHFDLRAALAAGSPHAKRVCASRHELLERFDPAARDAFAEAFDACHLPR